jgi:hypothetical protein
MPRKDAVELTVELKHTLIQAKDHDLIMMFVDPDATEDQIAALEDFMDALSERTGAVLAAFPNNVLTDCQNYTLHDLLGVRESLDNLIAERAAQYPTVDS